MILKKISGSGIKSAAYKFYRTAQHLLVPGLQNSQYAYKEVLRLYVNRDVRWLDLGCGRQLFPAWMPSSAEEQTTFVRRCKAVVGIDMDYSSVCKHPAIKNRVVGDIRRLPFADSSFDLITANVVLEHVQDPNTLLADVHRVLRPASIFIFHTPNLLAYATLISRLLPPTIKSRLLRFLQGRKEEDVFRTYYRINTPRAVRSLAERSGFHVLELRLIESSAQTVMLGPIVILELIWIRVLRLRSFSTLRTNIIAVLRRSAPAGPLPSEGFAPGPS